MQLLTMGCLILVSLSATSIIALFSKRVRRGVHQFVCEPHESVGMVGTVTVEAAPDVVEEEESEPESVETPSVSLISSLCLLAVVAVMRRPSEE
jgi:hypothetical protein